MIYPIRLLDSYREYQNDESLKALERTRSGTALAAPIPVSFPESYPFSLFAQAPNTERTDIMSGASTQSVQVTYFNCTLAEIGVVFLVLVLSSPKKDIFNFLESSLEIEGKDNFANLISSFFRVSVSILDNEAFPSTWMNVNILAHKVLIKIVDPVAQLLERDFIPQAQDFKFNASLWREALYMLLKLLSSDQLVIEEFSPQVSLS